MKSVFILVLILAALPAAGVDDPAQPLKAIHPAVVDPAAVADLYRHSLEVAEEVRKRAPTLARAVFELARVHERFGYDDQAVEVYRQGLRLEPRRPDILLDVAFLLSQRKQDEALQVYQHALRLAPDLGGARTRIGLILAHQGRHHEAVEALRGEIDNRTPTALTYLVLGQAFQDLGRLEEALGCYREAVRLDPSDRRAHYARAQVCQALERKEEEDQAREEFRKIKAREDVETRRATSKEARRGEELRWTALTYLDAALTYLDPSLPLKDSASALRCLRASVRFDPGLLSARRMLLEQLRSGRQVEEAAAQCREALALQRTPDILFRAADLAMEGKAFAEAARLLEEAVALSTDEADARRELAVLILRGRTPGTRERALLLARQAVAAAPIAPNYDVLGYALFEMQDHQGALEALQAAVKLEPRNEDYQKRLERVEGKVERRTRP